MIMLLPELIIIVTCIAMRSVRSLKVIYVLCSLISSTTWSAQAASYNLWLFTTTNQLTGKSHQSSFHPWSNISYQDSATWSCRQSPQAILILAHTSTRSATLLITHALRVSGRGADRTVSYIRIQQWLIITGSCCLVECQHLDTISHPAAVVRAALLLIKKERVSTSRNLFGVGHDSDNRSPVPDDIERILSAIVWEHQGVRRIVDDW